MKRNATGEKKEKKEKREKLMEGEMLGLAD